MPPRSPLAESATKYAHTPALTTLTTSQQGPALCVRARLRSGCAHGRRHTITTAVTARPHSGSSQARACWLCTSLCAMRAAAATCAPAALLPPNTPAAASEAAAAAHSSSSMYSPCSLSRLLRACSGRPSLAHSAATATGTDLSPARPARTGSAGAQADQSWRAQAPALRRPRGSARPHERCHTSRTPERRDARVHAGRPSQRPQSVQARLRCVLEHTQGPHTSPAQKRKTPMLGRTRAALRADSALQRCQHTL